MGRGPSRLTKSVASREKPAGAVWASNRLTCSLTTTVAPPGNGIFVIRAPEGVRSLVLSNSFASVPGLAAGWACHLGELSESARPRNRGGGAAVDPEAYGAALGEFINRFVLTLPPPEPMMCSRMNSGARCVPVDHGQMQPPGMGAPRSDRDAGSTTGLTRCSGACRRLRGGRTTHYLSGAARGRCGPRLGNAPRGRRREANERRYGGQDSACSGLQSY